MTEMKLIILVNLFLFCGGLRESTFRSIWDRVNLAEQHDKWEYSKIKCFVNFSEDKMKYVHRNNKHFKTCILLTKTKLMRNRCAINQNYNKIASS